jgi:ribosomal protein S19
MAIVRVVGGGAPTKEIFVSVEDMSLVLADVRRALPKLKRELSRKYRVEGVELSSRIPRLRNPIEPSQIIVPACVGIIVHVVTKAGDAIGVKISKHVGRWLKEFSKTRKSGRAKQLSKRVSKRGTGRS